MKQLLTLCLLLLIGSSATAQEAFRAEYDVKGYFSPLPDSVLMRNLAPMVLEITPTYWLFYHKAQMIQDSIIHAIMTSEGDSEKASNEANKIQKSGIIMHVQSDLQKSQRSVTHVLNYDFMQYDEKMERPHWTIDESVTEEHAGYPCHRATAKYFGRDWTVWYTPEIPTPAGPWKLWGLPGLIVKAEENEGKFGMTLTSFQAFNTQESKVGFEKLNQFGKVTKETKHKVVQLLELYTTDFVKFLQMRFPSATVTVVNGEGNPLTPEELRKKFINIEK